MKKLSKFGFWKILCSLSLVIGLGVGEAGARCPDEIADSYETTPPNAPLNVIVALSKLPALKDEIEDMCDDYGCTFNSLSTRAGIAECMQENGQYGNYRNKLQQYNSLLTEISNTAQKFLDEGGKSCGTDYPFGCPNGQKCWTKTSTESYGSIGTTNFQTHSSTTTRWTCSDTSPGENWDESVEGSKGVGYISKSYDYMLASHSQLTDTKNTDNTEKIVDKNVAVSVPIPTVGDIEIGEVKTTDITETGIRTVTFEQIASSYTRTNEACHIDQLKEKYMGTCYSCVVVSAIISTFMAVANLAEPLMQDAGTKLLLIGMMIWIPIYILGKLSSFVSLEPMKMAQELLTFFFKCLLAYTLITSGLRTISTLIVNPLLVAGADYGIAIIDAVMPENLNVDGVTEDNKSYRIAASNSIDRKTFDRIMTISKKADAAVSLNFVIGNALFCHSYNAGAISFKIPITETTGIPFYFPDFWLMLCGAAIWFFAFLVVMGINFYLLDLSFKIGFALMALPVTLGLWPFNKFKSKFVECVKIIINAAGTFMFLGISTGITIVLISSALGGTERLLKEINANNQEYVSQLFSLTGSSFLIILFAFFYSHNLISETVSKLTDKFFSSKMSGLNPMHEKTTQMIDFAKKQIGNAASTISGGVGGMAANATRGVATKAARKVVDGIRRKGRDDK